MTFKTLTLKNSFREFNFNFSTTFGPNKDQFSWI